MVTGGEAVYADMGHFGRRPIQYAWFLVALPCLLLNYFGQGALLLNHPIVSVNPFFHMAPKSLTYPLVILAAMATVIASQAVISGVFSLTRQAIMLGYFPRVRILHTSFKEIGQIYIPLLNWIMLVATIFLVFFFQSSSALAAAYGIAVSITMLITTLLIYELVITKWKVSKLVSVPLLILFLIIDFSFLSANSMKMLRGGWFPIALGLMIFIVMSTWSKGRRILNLRLRKYLKPLTVFMDELDTSEYPVVSGTAVYLNGDHLTTAPSFVHNLKHNKVLHKRIVFLNIRTLEVPYVENKDRVSVEKISGGAYRLLATYGFKQSPSILNVLELSKPLLDFDLEIEETSFFLGFESIIPTDLKGMALWREKLFALISRNQLVATDHFEIPRDRVIELGIQVEI